MNRKQSISYSVGIVIMLALLSISLGGCNQTTNGKQTAIPTPAKRSTTPSTVSENPISTTTIPTVVEEPTSTTDTNSSKKSCGTLLYEQQEGSAELTFSRVIIGVTDAQEGVSCFLQAFQQCAPASMGFTVYIKRSAKVVTTKMYDFEMMSQAGNCIISATVDVNMRQSVTQEMCGRVEKADPDGLRFVNCEKSGTLAFPLGGTKPAR